MVEYKKKSMPKELLDLFGDSSYVNFESIINPPKYLKDRLEKEINKRDNSEDLRKKIIITKNEIYFILNVLTDEEYNKLVEKVSFEGLWYIEYCNENEIYRVLNPKNASDLLLKMRADYIADYPRLLRVFKKRKEIFLLKENKEWSLTNYYENDKLFDYYIKKIKPHLKKTCKMVNSGFIPMNEVNGICQRTEYGNIIFLSESLSQFLFYMNLWLMDFEEYNLSEKTKMEALYIGLRIMLGKEVFDFDIDPRYDNLPKKLVDSLNTIVDNQLLFIIGHEYAHHTLDHLNKNMVMKINSNNLFFEDKKNDEYKIYNYSQKQEFEADYYSFQNANLNKKDKEYMLNGAFTFFMYVDIYNLVKDTLLPQIMHISEYSDSNVGVQPDTFAMRFSRL